MPIAISWTNFFFINSAGNVVLPYIERASYPDETFGLFCNPPSFPTVLSLAQQVVFRDLSSSKLKKQEKNYNIFVNFEKNSEINFFRLFFLH